jgi:hypothetical protein
MPYCDTECFEVFLNELSKQKPEEFKILFLDNGAFHKAKKLVIPGNGGTLLYPTIFARTKPSRKSMGIY